ncbi:sensor histidine kinase [Falsiroseomonas sp.]|uniref:sensor histidine kinase n=1 Tax=Falsiroseomonas sp. TaxID=2870721 RepID=UPI003F6F2B67
MEGSLGAPRRGTGAWGGWPGRAGEGLRRAAPLLGLACAPPGLLLLQDGQAAAGGAVLAAGIALSSAAALWAGGPKAKWPSSNGPEPDSAGISIWIEDWTEVGRSLAELHRAGLDIPAHCAAHPELVERLHATIRIIDVNDATLGLMGLADKRLLIGPLQQVVPASAQTVPRWIAAMARGERVYRSESRITRADGEQRDCLVTALLPQRPEDWARIAVSVVDISDYKADQARLARVERELARATHAATVGVVTASIAHEVKNPLAAVVTNGEAALRWLRRPEPDLAEAEQAIGAVVADALRARDVVDRTRLLLSNAPLAPLRLHLAEVVRDSAALVDAELRAAGARLSIHIAPETPHVRADLSRLRQIVTNLLVNAAQAMSQAPEPREITVRAMAQEGWVRVEVADTGAGIASESLGRIFEPFYTTKTGGIGVGLAICRASVEAHGGRIWATNADQGGAVIHFTLPVAP